MKAETATAPPVLRGATRVTSAPAAACLLPGPVALAPAVEAAFRAPVVYHRADEFLPLFERSRARLAALANAPRAALFVGSGTLANEAVAATLVADPRRADGLVLVNGEFGGRLLKQARRWGLNPRVLAWDWGRPWPLGEVEAALRDLPAGGWVWGAHHETSAGVLNDLPGLVDAATRHGQRVVVDCVSSLAAVPVNLSGVYLASGASGKAVGSYPGLAFVFGDPAELAHLDPEAIPTYLDVPTTLAATGPRFTVPSPLVAALDAALDPLATQAGRAARFRHVAALGTRLRDGLKSLGFAPMAADADACPAVVTFAPPAGESAAAFVARCHRGGYQIAGQSGYLAERGLVQVAVMGAVTRGHVDGLLGLLAKR